jgi:hypothetical protein
MDKISVIIPTMWKSEGFVHRLAKLSNIETIGEIILIDNTSNTTILPIPKVIHIIEGENTFVNPAWNKGVNLSKWDKLCIMNDDVEVHDELFINILPHITEDKGMIGLHEYHGNGVWEDEPGCDRTRSELLRGNRFPLKLIESERHNRRPGYGCLWFIHKKSYIHIPHELKIWYGDDYLYHRNGKPNYSMMNVDIIGKPSQTSDLSEFDETKRNDQRVWSTL